MSFEKKKAFIGQHTRKEHGIDQNDQRMISEEAFRLNFEGQVRPII